MLAEQNLMVGVRPVALTPPNSFRTDRLYTEEVDSLYKKHLPLLKAIYSAFRRTPPGGGLRLKVGHCFSFLFSWDACLWGKDACLHTLPSEEYLLAMALLSAAFFLAPLRCVYLCICKQGAKHGWAALHESAFYGMVVLTMLLQDHRLWFVWSGWSITMYLCTEWPTCNSTWTSV